jgi:acetyl-CoA C-acetyltransferase
MAEAAAVLAGQLGIGRAEQEAWAAASHARALASPGAGIVPLEGVARDAFARHLTPALMARAREVAPGITAVTAAVAADAAAFALVAADDLAGPGALRILSGATLGAAPEQPGLAPLAAITAALASAELGPRDLARAEIMEAYAVQALACIRGAGLPGAIVNPEGGGLARGHPIGASGAILAVSLFHGLARGAGLAAIASAGGIGTALVLGRSAA